MLHSAYPTSRSRQAPGYCESNPFADIDQAIPFGMTETQKISWKRLAIEAVAIVASILLAFAIDAWWNERQLRVGEAELLAGLQQEFRHNRTVLVQSIELHSTILGGLQELLIASRKGAWQSETLTFDQALVYLTAPPTLDFDGGVLDALVSADRFEIISNRNLRIKLAGWRSVFEEVRDDEIFNRDLVFDQVVPYLLRWHVPVSRSFEGRIGYWPVASKSIADDPNGLSRLLSSKYCSVFATGILITPRVNMNWHLQRSTVFWMSLRSLAESRIWFFGHAIDQQPKLRLGAVLSTWFCHYN